MKMKKRVAAVAMAAFMAVSAAACGNGGDKNEGANKTDDSKTTTQQEQTNQQTTQQEQKTDNEVKTTTSELAPMTLEVYSQPANFQGEQPGWTAKILKDKFNVTLSIIAPQSAGGDIFAARSAAGFLGDIVVLDNADIQSCVKAGLIFDFTNEMKTFQSFNVYKGQLDYYNASIEGVSAGQYFAWPTEMTNTGATAFNPLVPGTPGSAPTVPWDYYREIGAPELKNLTDLIAALKAMQDAHPNNAAGDPVYGITLWPDWDGGSIENVNQLTKWYGQEVMNGNSAIMLDTKGNMIELTDDNGAYKKILQFYFDANKAGVVDPDSGTQNWDSVNQKFVNKRALLIWNDWQQGFWNSSARGATGENYIMAPVGDMLIYQPGDTYYGSGRAFACGTNDPAKKERVRMVMDWMSSPEGLEAIHGGIKGFTYEDAPGGKFNQTVIGETAIGDNTPVPAEYGGGTFADGMMQINQWMAAATAVDPNTGDSYDPRTWTTTIAKLQTMTRSEWAARFGASDPVTYLKEKGQLGVVPSVNVSLAPDTSDITVIRTSCKPLVCDASWKMIFAKDQAEFDAIWSKLKDDLKGFGWDQLVQFDKEKYKALVDERAKALANQ